MLNVITYCKVMVAVAVLLIVLHQLRIAERKLAQFRSIDH